jgi:hypothetical protein
LTISLYLRYRKRVLILFWFLTDFDLLKSIWRVRQDFSTTYEDFTGSTMWDEMWYQSRKKTSWKTNF